MTVSVDAYLNVDNKLADHLLTTWRQYVNHTFLFKLNSMVKAGNFQEARDYVKSFDFSGYMREVEPFIRAYTPVPIGYGSTRANNGEIDPGLVSDADYIENYELGVKFMLAMVADSLAEFAREHAYTVVQNASQKYVSKAAAPVDPVEALRTKLERQAIFIAGLHNSRMATLGFTLEARRKGITRYALNEQLDNHVCGVCRVMHGRTFVVDDAYRRVRTLLQSDPAKMRELAPWPDNSEDHVKEMAGMSREDILGRGWHIPPFHVGCRGVLVTPKDVPDLHDTPSFRTAVVLHPKLSKYTPIAADFWAVGLFKDSMLETAMKWWGAHATVSPRRFIGDLIGVEPGLITADYLRRKALKIGYDFTKDLTTVNYYGEMWGSTAPVALKFTLGAAHKQAYLDRITFFAEEKGIAATVFGATLNALQSLGAESVATQASGFSAYSLARMGWVAGDRLEAPYLRQQIMVRATALGAALSTNELDLVKAMVAGDQVKYLPAVAALQKVVPGGLKLGQYLLQGLTYEALLDFLSAETKAYISQYLGSPVTKLDRVLKGLFRVNTTRSGNPYHESTNGQFSGKPSKGEGVMYNHGLSPGATTKDLRMDVEGLTTRLLGVTSQEFSDKGGSIRVGKSPINPQTLTVAFQGPIHGSMDTTLELSFSPKRDEVSLDFFRVDEGSQGKGISKKVMRALVDKTAAHGYDHIGLFANIDNGAHAWAKYGFQTDTGNWNRFSKEHLIPRLKQLEQSFKDGSLNQKKFARDPRFKDKPLSDIDFKVANVIARSTKPSALWAMADHRLGKHVMPSTPQHDEGAWIGVLDYKDPAAMARFKHYMGA